MKPVSISRRKSGHPLLVSDLNRGVAHADPVPPLGADMVDLAPVVDLAPAVDLAPVVEIVAETEIAEANPGAKFLESSKGTH